LETVIEYVIAIVALSSFVLAGFFDWKTREINPKIWIIPISTGVAMNAIYIFLMKNHCVNSILLFQIGITTFLVILIAVLVFVFNLLGGADFMGMISFAALYPFNRLFACNYKMFTENNIYIFLLNFLPPILWLLIIHSIIMVLFILENAISNIIKYREIQQLNLSLCRKLFLIVFNRFMRVEEYLKKKFYYPVYVPGIIDRLTFNIYEDDDAWKKKLEKLPKDTIIVVSWGIPMVSFLSISIAIYVTLYMMFYLSIT